MVKKKKGFGKFWRKSVLWRRRKTALGHSKGSLYCEEKEKKALEYSKGGDEGKNVFDTFCSKLPKR